MKPDFDALAADYLRIETAEGNVDGSDVKPRLSALLASVHAAARNEALEEAAKECLEIHSRIHGSGLEKRGARISCLSCTTGIRALKGTP